jgi:hypothetical protein
MVLHACNPSFSGGRGRRIVVQWWPKQKQETLPEKQSKSLGCGSSGRALSSIPVPPRKKKRILKAAREKDSPHTEEPE